MIYSLWINKNGVVGINNNQSKWINSIGRYLNQNEIIETVEMNRLDWVPCKYAFFTTQNLVNRDHMGSIDFTGFFIKIVRKMCNFRAIQWPHE